MTISKLQKIAIGALAVIGSQLVDTGLKMDEREMRQYVIDVGAGLCLANFIIRFSHYKVRRENPEVDYYSYD